MADAPQFVLDHHLKTLKPPTFLREYAKQARFPAVKQDNVHDLSHIC